jgi:hypothetical protein
MLELVRDARMVWTAVVELAGLMPANANPSAAIDAAALVVRDTPRLATAQRHSTGPQGDAGDALQRALGVLPGVVAEVDLAVGVIGETVDEAASSGHGLEADVVKAVLSPILWNSVSVAVLPMPRSWASHYSCCGLFAGAGAAGRGAGGVAGCRARGAGMVDG